MAEGKPYYGQQDNGDLSGDIFCIDCGNDTDQMTTWVDDGEVDSPIHCTTCNKPLDCTYTEECQKYVLGEIIDVINTLYDANDPRRDTIDNAGWYNGLPVIAITLDWAHELRNYTMEHSDSILVNWFTDNIEQDYNFERLTSRIQR